MLEILEFKAQDVHHTVHTDSIWSYRFIKVQNMGCIPTSILLTNAVNNSRTVTVCVHFTEGAVHNWMLY